MIIDIPIILSKGLLKIAANTSLAVGCLLMVSCDGDSSPSKQGPAPSDGNLSPFEQGLAPSDSNSSLPEQGLAPSALNGVSITFIDSGLVLNIDENGVDWYQARVVATQGSVLADGGRGTLTYKASGDKGIIEYVAFSGDIEKATLTFTSESAGTYIITDNGANEAGSFALVDISQLKAPSSIAGLTINYVVVSGAGKFGSEGSSTLVYSEDGATFDGVRDDNGFILKGSFTYFAAGNIGDFGNIRIQEFKREKGKPKDEYEVNFLLTFFTETTGTFLMTLSDSFQTGTFEIISGP